MTCGSGFSRTSISVALERPRHALTDRVGFRMAGAFQAPDSHWRDNQFNIFAYLLHRSIPLLLSLRANDAISEQC